MANRTWLFDAPFIETQQRTFLKLQGEESIPRTKENCGGSIQWGERGMLMLQLRWNGTQRPNIWWSERLCVKCYYCHDDDWIHVEITFTGIATDGLCIFPSYSSKTLKAAFLINQKQASHAHAERITWACKLCFELNVKGMYPILSGNKNWKYND